MGAIRKRFTPAERAAFTIGTPVQWLNSTTWKLGIVAGEIQVTDGYQELPVQNRSHTGFTRFGETVNVSAKHVRLAHKPNS